MWCHRNNAALLELLQFKTWRSDGVRKSSQLNEAWQMFSTTSEKMFFNLNITAGVPDVFKSQHTCPCERFQETKKRTKHRHQQEPKVYDHSEGFAVDILMRQSMRETISWRLGWGRSWVLIWTVTPHGKIWTGGISTEPPIKNHSSIWKTMVMRWGFGKHQSPDRYHQDRESVVFHFTSFIYSSHYTLSLTCALGFFEWP